MNMIGFDEFIAVSLHAKMMSFPRGHVVWCRLEYVCSSITPEAQPTKQVQVNIRGGCWFLFASLFE